MLAGHGVPVVRAGDVAVIRFTILGEPASKANQRRVVKIAGEPRLIKSAKALAYEGDALLQIPPRCRVQLEGPVAVTLRIWYASQRPDLDESLILDVLQDRFKGKGEARTLVQKGVYRNDRQVREKHVFWGLDRINPRCEIEVIAAFPQQPELPIERETWTDPFRVDAHLEPVR